MVFLLVFIVFFVVVVGFFFFQMIKTDQAKFNTIIFHRGKNNLIYDINLQICVKATHCAMKSVINQMEIFFYF